MKKSEYDALKLKIAAELWEVYEKNKSLVHYKTMIESEAASVSWAIGQVLSESYGENCKYHHVATLDAIEDFVLHQWSLQNDELDFEPEDVTGRCPQMLIIDEASGWGDMDLNEANLEATFKSIGSKLYGSGKVIPTKFYGKGLSDLIEEIGSANDAGQILNSMVHPPITSQMTTGPWPQAGVYPYVIGPANAPETAQKAEEKPSEDDGWGGNAKPQSAAEDFSAIAKRMKELAAEKGNS